MVTATVSDKRDTDPTSVDMVLTMTSNEPVDGMFYFASFEYVEETRVLRSMVLCTPTNAFQNKTGTLSDIELCLILSVLCQVPCRWDEARGPNGSGTGKWGSGDDHGRERLGKHVGCCTYI